MSEDTHPSARGNAPVVMPPGWTRPTPVQHDNNFRSWMLFFAGICLIVALWVPIRTAWQRARYQPVSDMVREADSFMVLAYGGVSAGRERGPEDVSRTQFEQHIRTLHARGFHPVGLADIVAFYRDGTPLPRQAVLITLEQSKKSSYLETRAILQEYRWQAVMFVRSDTINRKDPDVLRWPILRDMARSATWDVAPQSGRGFQMVPAGPDGATGNFFSTPMWLERERRLETIQEFKARIHAEHRRTVAEFTEQVGHTPAAFGFPFGDYGQFDARAVATRVVNLGAIEEFYPLGFSMGPFLLNTRRSDPRALNRLLVNPEWSLDEFVAILESAQAVKPPDIQAPLTLSRWRTLWGLTEVATNGVFTVRSVREHDIGHGRPTTGALTWMAGSDLFEDVTLKMRFRLEGGQFGVRLRYRAGGEEGLRFLMDRAGNCRLLQKRYGSEEFLLAAEARSGFATGREHELELALVGRTAIVRLDGELVFGEPIALMGEATPGLLGLEVWDPQPERAELGVLSLHFPQQRQTLLYWEAATQSDGAGFVARIQREAWRYAAISPPWLDVQHSVPLVLPTWDDHALATFASIHGVPVLPRIMLHSTELATSIAPELTVREAVRMGVGGVYLDCRHLPVDEISVLMPWLQAFYEQTKEHNMKLAMTLPDAIKRMAAFASIAGLFPGAMMAVAEADLAEKLADRVDHVVASERLVQLPDDMHLTLYYQLATRELAEEALSPRVRQDANRAAGMLAYHEGDYEMAIAHWQAWLTDDPQDAEAMALIGRAYLKLGEAEAALDYYTRSLDAAPGQISMAIRRAELLDTIGRVDEARQQLNLYARIFPEHAAVIIAQAKWLDRRNRRIEARGMLETLVQEQPLNIAARVALLELQEQSSERYQTLRDVLALGRAADAQLPFGNMLLSQELLTYPESGIFFEYIRDRAASASSDQVRRLYERFLPLTSRVTDHFALGRLSDQWVASDGIRVLDRGRYELRTAIDQTEAYLRLHRSELMRDGYLDVVLDETQGFFWVYARRSSRAMVRFGFDQDGFIHLQAWLDGDLLAHHSRPWIRPPGSLNMRLELRGDGARGYVNQLEIFDMPLGIPPQVAYGWWGIAPFSFELGMARARILKMECEPLPPVIAMIPPGDMNEQVVALRPYVGTLSALAPAWLFQQPDGSLPRTLPEQAGLMRMFCAFHRIRLLPVVALAYDGNVTPQAVVDLIHSHQLSGVVLKRRTVPNENWLMTLREALEARPATVIVLQTEAALWNTPQAGDETKSQYVVRPIVRDDLLPQQDDPILLHELPVGSMLLSPLRTQWHVPITSPEASTEDADDLVAPRLALMGPDGWLVREVAADTDKQVVEQEP